jgi:MSHA biogenesis protein MshN
MSVINRVLQDLERRHARPDDARLGSSAVRATVKPRVLSRPSGALTPLAVGTLVSLAGAAAWLAPGLLDRQEALPGQGTVVDAGLPEVEAPPPAVPAAPDVAALPAQPPAADQARERAAATSAKPVGDARAARRTGRSRPVRPPEVGLPPVAAPGGEPAGPNGRPAHEPLPDDRPAAAVAAGKGTIERQERPLTAPAQAEIQFRKGVQHLRQGHTAEAASALREALAHDPTHAASRQALLALLLEEGSTSEAEGVVREGLLASPGHAPYAMVLARLQAQRGDLAAAVHTLEAHRAAGQRNGDYLSMLAALLQRQSRHAEAAEAYGAALATGGARGAWYMGQGISLRELGRPDEAATAFRRALESGALAGEVRSYVERQLAALDRLPGR